MAAQMKIIPMNKSIWLVSFNLGVVIIFLDLYFPYHNLYAKMEIARLIISDVKVNPALYPLIKSHNVFPKTDPIAPYGPKSSPEMNIIPKWGE